MGGRPSEFVALSRLRRGFDDVRLGRSLSEDDRDALLELVGQIGGCALPLCERRLRGGGDQESLWAFELVVAMASDEELAERVTACLARAARDPDASETARMMCLALLTQLDVELDDDVAGDDALASLHQRSVEELARHLDQRPDIARAADHLARELEAGELLQLVQALCVAEGARAEPLIDELMCRDDVHEQVRGELGRIAAPIRDRRARITPATPPALESRAYLGQKADASQVLVCSQRIAGSRPIRVRALCSAVAGGRLIDGMYRDDFTRRGVEREIVRPLERDGFVFRELPLEVAGELLARTARDTHHAGAPLPRAYFLGRDIVGLTDEHVTERRRRLCRDHSSPLLARALDLMNAGEHARARGLLERYQQGRPDAADGASALGLCLARAGELDAAVAQLRRATALEPGVADHYWNLAAVCHRAGDRAGCYLAMRELSRCPRSPLEAGGNRDRARLEVERYERRARLEFPGVPATAVARAEQHAWLADRLAEDGSLGEAATELRRAVRETADHYPSWAQLGVIHAERGESRKARRCFERALALCPGYQPAVDALANLAPEQAGRTATARALPKRKRPAPKQRGARLSPR